MDEYVYIGELDVTKLNALIDKGETFYVHKGDPIFDDSLWSTNHSFWGDRDD